MLLHLNLNSVADYQLFLKAKSLPRYRCVGRTVEVPDEYAHLFRDTQIEPAAKEYEPESFLFDYQRDITRLALHKRKFAVFAACGLGKSLICTEFCRHVHKLFGGERNILIVTPPLVIRQMMGEVQRFYRGKLSMQPVRAAQLQEWLNTGTGIGLTNWEAIREGLTPGRLGALVLDESSTLKSHYGAWGQRLIELGRGLPYKLCATGTPAPNDRIEFANHAVFLDQYPTVNSFLARFFVNRGQTQNRWEMKPHALRPFYTSLSHWCIFLERPATYGWKDNNDAIPPIYVHIHDVPLTPEQVALVGKAGGDMFGGPGGITSRAKLSQLAKGTYRLDPEEVDDEGVPIKEGKVISVPTNKPQFIRDLVDSWPEESTIVWCRFNREQELLEKIFPDAVSIKGATPDDERERLIDAFKTGTKRVCISKAEVMGFGLNLQIATRQVFSSCEDSWEEFHQAVKRSNRIGSTRPLNVHLPVTELERQMMENVLRKAHRVQQDTEEQERIFKENGYVGIARSCG